LALATKMAELTNPTTHSNWVLPGRLAIGGYPDPEGGYPEQLLAAGFDVFASLQTSPELAKFRAYQHLLPDHVLWLQLPITDRGTTNDEKLLAFIKLLRYLLDQGRQIYVHCHGSHGRSGTLACVLLSQVEQLPHNAAVAKANLQHRTRAYKPDVRIPQCNGQCLQVQRLCLP
jgi:hypothetical protein